jgi:hypothetical protein
MGLFIERGPEAIDQWPIPGKISKFDVEAKARLIAKTHGDVPEDQICMTMWLLTD